MDYIERLGNARIVPVVVIDNAIDAVHTANAFYEGGINVMEITLRTESALDAIRNVSTSCPNVLVGAGSVLSLEKCKAAVAEGAEFIVCPGFDEEIVKWCINNDITIIPGCVTPTEIMAALKYGITILKFFPANIYGGFEAMEALSGPFGMVKFIPTGGVNAQNLSKFLTAPFIHAVGGSWICTRADIYASDFGKITALCKVAVDLVKGLNLPNRQ